MYPGPSRSRHQDALKHAKMLLDDIHMRENGEGARESWENNQTLMPV